MDSSNRTLSAIKPKRVLIDSNIPKLSIVARRIVYVVKHQKRNPNGIDTFATYQTTYDYPLYRLKARKNQQRLIRDSVALFLLSELAQKEFLQFFVTREILSECSRLPKQESVTGALFGSKLLRLHAPFGHERVFALSERESRSRQLDFLTQISDSRFLAIKAVTGGEENSSSHWENQLIDAFHLWCAESAGCDCFLSVDYKLKNKIRNSKLDTVAIVSPEELVNEIFSSMRTLQVARLLASTLSSSIRKRRMITKPWDLTASNIF